MIHATAIIHPKAELDPTVTVGPFAVIDHGVVIGPRCDIGPHVYLTGLTTIGTNNRFHAGCVIGNSPQDLKYKGDPTSLQVGDSNTFREHVTVNRSTKPGDQTIIGSNNLLMASCHVAHDVVIGDGTIIVNGALLGGHVTVGDRALVSGNCLVHQFVRIGTLAIMQGGSAISQDLPPFTVARGDNGICGLNVIGLRRAGLTVEQRLELRKLYQLLFRSGQKLGDAVAAAQKTFKSEYARLLIDFVLSSKRGICTDTGKSNDREDEE
jgi:UDP-N-acetylglucosamine acyltransferase